MERPPPRPRQVVKYVSSDSPTLFLSGGDDKTLRLWDTRTASEARHPTPNPNPNCIRGAPLVRVRVSIRGAPRSASKTARLQPCASQAATPRPACQVRQLSFDGGVNSVEISRDQRTATVAAGNQAHAPPPPPPPSSSLSPCLAIHHRRHDPSPPTHGPVQPLARRFPSGTWGRTSARSATPYR